MLGTVMPIWSTPRSPGSAGPSPNVVVGSSTFNSLRACCDRSYVTSSTSRYSGDRVSVLVFAGAAFHELHEPLSEARLEGSYHPRGRTADHHSRRDRDGKERGFRHLVVHVACFATALCRQDVAQRFGRERRLLERDDPREREVLGEHEGLGQLRAGVPGLFFEALLEPSQELL